MKILEINKYFYLKGGSERYFFDLSNVLNEHGHEVVHFSMQNPKNFPSAQSDYFIDPVDLEKFNIINISKFFYNFNAVQQLKKLIRDEKPDIAHLHNIAHHISPAIIKVLKDNHIPIIQTLHDYKLICPNYRLFTENQICLRCQNGNYYNCLKHKCLHDSRGKSFMAMIEMYLYKRILKYYDQIDLFIAPSQYLKTVCVKFGIPENKIKVLNNFIDIPAEKINTDYLSENYILYFGRLSDEKGIDVLIKAFAESNHKYILRIAGEGPQIYELMSLAQDLGVSERVDFVGQQHGEILEHQIAGAKAIVLPSRWPENMPYSLLEAMAMGKAVIVAEVGGLPELIKHKETGFVFPTGDVQALSNILDNLENYDLNLIGHNARAKVKTINSENHYLELIKYFDEYRQKK